MTTTFQLTGPLPDSTLLLEASAGTGKTFTIAALAVRYVAEAGLDIGELLMITFNTNAADELRARVHGALVDAAAHLRAVADGGAPPTDNPVAEHLAGLGDPELRIARIERALDGFDRATITTTHAFCRGALVRLGVLGDADPAERIVAPGPLVDECAADVYLAHFSDVEEPPFPPRRAAHLARQACASTLPLGPEGSAEATYGAAVRDAFAARVRERGLLTFDDLVTRMRDLLHDRVTGPHAVRALRAAHRVVLVDEFQDTDPDQWQVIRDAFVAPDRPTILIGDPKQSIYGFRNADLVSYLDAAALATTASLTTNHRSDVGVVDGVVELLRDVPLGPGDIAVHPVDARHPARLELPVPERVWVRQVEGPDVRDRVLDDVADHVAAVLAQTIDGHPVLASDVAVLVRTASSARTVADRLAAHGIPAVQHAASSLVRQPAADDWRHLLRALVPGDDAAVRLLALTDLVGLGPAALGEDRAVTELVAMVRRAADALTADGPGAALDVVREHTHLEARLAPTPDGPRHLTDLAHLAELLDASGARNPRELLALLDDADQFDAAGGPRVADDRPAVRVMTLHAAKGREFPVVLLPDLSPLPLYLNRPFNVVLDGRRVLWLQAADESSRIGAVAAAQAREEELRLLYVGLTRARHLAVVWHTDEPGSVRGPVAAALLHERGDATLADAHPFRVVDSRPGVRVSSVPTRVTPRPAPTPPAPPEPELAVSTRVIDQDWRRTSYSGLTRSLHELPSGADEPESPTPAAIDRALAGPVPMGTLPAGAAFGTLVHEILELLDWADDHREAAIRELVDRRAVTFDPEQRDALAAGLEAVVTTPMAPLLDGSLSSVPVTQRLTELDFDLPLGRRGAATVGALAELLATHLPASDPLAGYPERLATSAAAPERLVGFLTGSIDVVVETPEGRFVVCDYKTNRLAGSPDEELTVGHHTRPAMAEAMMAAHYPLQAILYCAALHRFLSLRLPGYRPERHLGGVGYLFVRGMAGPDTPVVDGSACGVLPWLPSPELVVAVSELLEGPDA
ncbi:UvrD-helicase domain-containing protein [uncultured Tessaracoccus sp.]|uniref:UvrD-helicase domain-containing protein n=1 Tax=uncultured Tessaracoccus sp. TaxID=905023 RepID=UPI0025EEBCEE|nr:UvrD-helicase domain-containing protein [uncultured Tessaracoccus sp.]